MLAYIWAEDEKKQIGLEGKLPWHLPDDLAYFKKTTLNHPIVMGKKTFASFPNLLPNRLHVVLTHDQELAQKAQTNPMLEVFNSLEQLRIWLNDKQNELIFIIGGASLFETFKDEVDLLYVTKIHAIFKADTKMPELDEKAFTLVKQTAGLVNKKNKYAHDFCLYQRK
ncbi:dihydrofolate reductase [Ligilactobacillus sp. WC1T17]|uniref:Dihydrofolate reductase n=1 Tax=Ligilactobacillus ruminis TaxID=1623 RepID=A0ABY1AA49_9LACO|nr:dihydrofolate reductase [Ligilactobacillus ruminis]